MLSSEWARHARRNDASNVRLASNRAAIDANVMSRTGACSRQSRPKCPELLEIS
jgi:hypothetical protein